MVGRGKAPVTRGRKAISATQDGSSEEQLPQYIVDIRAQMQALEERLSARLDQLVPQPAVVQPILPPVEQPALVLRVQLAVPEQCLQLLGQFQIVGAPEFLGASHPQIADSATVVETERAVSQSTTETADQGTSVQSPPRRKRPFAAVTQQQAVKQMTIFLRRFSRSLDLGDLLQMFCEVTAFDA